MTAGAAGASAGRLGIPAPGDLRRCLVALSDADADPLAVAFEHRFEAASSPGTRSGT